jgi:membrane protein
VQRLANAFLPGNAETGESLLDPILAEVVRTRAVSGIFGIVGFAWASTRLFGSLRTVMNLVFERRSERNFITGKLWDLFLAGMAAVLVALWVGLNAFLAIGSGRLGSVLTQIGLLEDLVGGIEYTLARAISVMVVAFIFFALYRWLPKRRTPWRIALVGGVTAVTLFEVARVLFMLAAPHMDLDSLYSGTLAALVIVVFWTYYAAVIFLVGAEVAHATEKALAKPRM